MRLPVMRLAPTAKKDRDGQKVYWDDRTMAVLNSYLSQIREAINNKIEFVDNMYLDSISFTASGPLGTDHTLAHDLNKVPSGFFVVCSLSGTVFSSGGGAWDADNIYLSTISPLTAGQTDTVTVYVF